MRPYRDWVTNKLTKNFSVHGSRYPPYLVEITITLIFTYTGHVYRRALQCYRNDILYKWCTETLFLELHLCLVRRCPSLDTLQTGMLVFLTSGYHGSLFCIQNYTPVKIISIILTMLFRFSRATSYCNLELNN